MADIKPCPFCGGEAITYELEANTCGKWGWAQCATCGAIAPDVRTGGYPGEGWEPDALEAWNTRALPSPMRDKETGE